MEQWKDIPGYEGLYEASNLGRIRTNADKVTSSARYPVRHWKQRILKLKYQARCTGKKDARVCLWKDGEERTWLVARLVAMAWCEGYAPGLTVNHIDGNPENNTCENLEWITRADNIRHAFTNGLYQTKAVDIEVNGERFSFPSMSAASKALGKGPKYISCMIGRGKPLVFTR